MKAKLTLRFKGAYFNHVDIYLPTWIHAMDFESNVKRREQYVAEQAQELRTLYLRTILKMNQEYEITLEVDSDPENRPEQCNPEQFIPLTQQHEP